MNIMSKAYHFILYDFVVCTYVFFVNTNIGAIRRLMALNGRKFVIRKP
jgi:hypothetical protein